MTSKSGFSMREYTQMNKIRSVAETLANGDNCRWVDINELYDLSVIQPTTIVTDVTMPANELGLSPERNKVMVSYSGEDSARSAWARELVPGKKDIAKDPSKRALLDKYERLTREIAYEMMQMPLVKTEVYIGKGEEFMIKARLVVTEDFAKLGLDWIVNFIQKSPVSEVLYKKSRPFEILDLNIVVYPEWVNPEWMWAQSKPAGSGKAPNRISMVFDVESNTAFLLGGRYFGELKKATLSLAWTSAVINNVGAAIHGSSKTIYINNNGKKEEKTFITIGLSGSGKSTIGNDPHKEFLDYKNGEKTKLGNDDALVILFEPRDKQKGTVGLEENMYNKSNDYTPGSFYIDTVLTAENVAVTTDENGKKIILHEDIRNGNGRVESLRRALQGAEDDVNLPWPDYVALIMKDECLPPVTLVKDPDLFVSMYMSLCTKSSSAENISVEEMGKLKMIPGANPFVIYDMNTEAHAVKRMITATGAYGLVLNTGGFYINKEKNDKDITTKVTKEITLSLYPKIAKGQMEWEKWSDFPGLYIPKKGTMGAEYDALFAPSRVKDRENYTVLLVDRIKQRIDFLKGLKLEDKFIAPLMNVIVNLSKK